MITCDKCKKQIDNPYHYRQRGMNHEFYDICIDCWENEHPDIVKNWGRWR